MPIARRGDPAFSIDRILRICAASIFAAMARVERGFGDRVLRPRLRVGVELREREFRHRLLGELGVQS
jgi:hypothetical protein